MQCCTPSCSCSNGIKATGTACTSHNANICTSCEADYFLDGQSCSKIQVCTTIDGSIENSIDCDCGTNLCTVATGRKCVASFDFCTSGFIPGNVTLSGSTLRPTSMGKYEWLGSNLNGKPTYKYSTMFLYWHSESKVWYIGPTLGISSGYIYWTDDVIRPELSPKPTTIKAYSNGAWTDDTTTITSSKACVAANGVSINDGECTCGTTDCDESTGFFCVVAYNTCSTNAICNAIDGVTENSIDCSCGTSDCDAGLFCVALLDFCTANYFVPGHLTLSGLTGSHKHLMGLYRWVAPFYSNGKPIYRYGSKYLYFLTNATEPDKYPGRWMVGPEVGNVSSYFYWIENVARPELSLFDTDQSKVQVTKSGNTLTFKSSCSSCWNDATISITSSKSCPDSYDGYGLSANVNQCTCVSLSLSV